jgi:nitroreductase
MLTTKDAIEQRRSIRKYQPDPVPDEHVMALIEAARLAPSGSNAQPWRFRIVTDEATRKKLASAARGQQFVAQAPVVIVCCADIEGYIKGTIRGAQDLGRTGALDARIVDILTQRAASLRNEAAADIGPRTAANVSIAIEHIVLRALDFGLGTCWVRLFDENAVKEIFGWGDSLFVVALLPVGYPAESPAPRRRLSIEEILLD